MVIIDCSVAYKWSAQNEEGHEQALSHLESHLAKDVKIVTLDLLRYELVNAWSTKTSLSIKDIDTNIHSLEKYEISYDHLTSSQLSEVVRMSKKYSVSGYDASYAVLAKSLGCDLITADKKFVDKVNLPFVKLLSS